MCRIAPLKEGRGGKSDGRAEGGERTVVTEEVGKKSGQGHGHESDGAAAQGNACMQRSG